MANLTTTCWNQTKFDTKAQHVAILICFIFNIFQIKWFWEVFHELPLAEKKKFLLYLTGSDRIPIQGMKAIKVSVYFCLHISLFLTWLEEKSCENAAMKGKSSFKNLYSNFNLKHVFNVKENVKFGYENIPESCFLKEHLILSATSLISVWFQMNMYVNGRCQWTLFKTNVYPILILIFI